LRADELIQKFLFWSSQQVFALELKQYYGVLQMAIEEISIKKSHLLSGQQKKSLSDLWLKHVKRRVTTYLTQQ
jgi:hypothetical protein